MTMGREMTMATTQHENDRKCQRGEYRRSLGMYSIPDECNTIAILAVMTIIVLLMGWIIRSHFEAEAYNGLTNSSATTWDAMFVQLRVVNQPASVFNHPIEEQVNHYTKGFNDALDAIALVSLEFAELKGTPKTFGQLADICRERRGIPEDGQ